VVTATPDAECLNARNLLKRALFDLAADGIVVLDMAGKALQVNQAFIDMLGLSPEQVGGLHVWDWDPAWPRERVLEGLRRLAPGQSHFETVWRRGDGSALDVEVSVTLVEESGMRLFFCVCRDIRLRRKAEASLRASEERYRTLYENSPAAIWHEDFSAVKARIEELERSGVGDLEAYLNEHPEELVELAGRVRILEVNPRSLEVLGARSRDELFLHLPRYFNEDSLAVFKREILALARGDARFQARIPVLDTGGAERLFEVSLAMEPRHAGDWSSVLVSFLDVTDPARAQTALQESEERYRTLAEQVPAIIYRAALDESSSTAYISGAIRQLGYFPEEWIGNAGLWAELLHPEDRESVLRMVAHSQRTGEPLSCEYRLRGKDGGWRDIHDQAQVVFDGEGRPVALQGVMRDITARKAAEAEIRKLTLMVNQSPISIVITDLDGRIEYVNEACVSITGYSREELTGQTPRVLKSGKTPQATYEALWEHLTSGQSWKGEFINRRKDGSEYHELATMVPLRQADGRVTHYAALKEDITEKRRIGRELDMHRHHLEELVAERTRQLDEARARAEVANRAKSSFIANMSHEIRTPLNAIIGLTHLMRRHALPVEQLQRLDKIDSAGQHLLSVIDLEPLEVNLFRGRSPQSGWQRVFGGQVLGQALMAATRTVDGRVCHSLHAYFIRPGDPKVPILYEVDRSRDGKSFATRRVVAIQHGEQIVDVAERRRRRRHLAVAAPADAPQVDAAAHRDEVALQHVHLVVEILPLEHDERRRLVDRMLDRDLARHRVGDEALLVGLVVDRVGLGAGRAGIADHGIEHLGCGDDRYSVPICHINDFFLDNWHG